MSALAPLRKGERASMSHKLLKPMLLDLLNATQAAQQKLITELSDTEREALGTAAHWSARDHVAHLTFWKRHLALTLAALACGETPPSKGDAQVLNAQVFERHRQRPWSDILLDSEQVHAELLASVERFTEEDLARTDWFPPEDGDEFPGGQPLWAAMLSKNGFWHPLEHFTQFYLDRNDVQRATEIQQAWADKMIQLEVPPVMRSIGLYILALFYATTKQEASAQEALDHAVALNPDPMMESYVLYNLAYFYVTNNQFTKAQDVLDRALALNPALIEFSKQDADLALLHRE